MRMERRGLTESKQLQEDKENRLEETPTTEERQASARTDRSFSHRSGRVPGEDSGIIAHSDLCAASGTTRLHTQSQWEDAAVGNPDGARPSSADGSPADTGADL